LIQNWLPCPVLLGRDRLLVRSTTRAPVNACKRGQRDTEKIKSRNRSVGKCEACRPHCFIAAWADLNSFVAIHDPTAVAKSPKKFHVFHERHVWKSSRVDERTAPAENSMIAASHPEQKPRVMRKAVRQSVYGRRDRQAYPEETATDFWIAHYARNLIQRLHRHFGVRSRAQLLARVLRHLEPPHWDELLSATGSGPALLSPRLQATLVCLLDGQSEKEVAAQLGVSPTTIHQYVSALYRRFGVASRAQLLGQILQRLTGGCREQLLERLAGQGAHGHA